MSYNWSSYQEFTNHLKSIEFDFSSDLDEYQTQKYPTIKSVRKKQNPLVIDLLQEKIW